MTACGGRPVGERVCSRQASGLSVAATCLVKVRPALRALAGSGNFKSAPMDGDKVRLVRKPSQNKNLYCRILDMRYLSPCVDLR